MLNRLIPMRVDNSFHGYRPALWIFGLFVTMKGIISLNSIFNGHTVATGADGIPLDTFTAAASQTVLALFALLSLSNLMLCLLGALILLRYRSLIPLMYAVFLVQQLGARLIDLVVPIPRVGSPPAFGINLVLLALVVGGFVLSLSRPPRALEA